jgi:homoserine O-acetyltransferase/O-succinyltransferase
MFRIAAFTMLIVSSPLTHSHWPDQPPHQIARLGKLSLEGGGVIDDLKMSYVTHGKLSKAKDNAILFMHGFGLNHHNIDHLIGPGRPLDSDKYFIVCVDGLGNTQTTFDHSTSPTNSGLKMNFPAYNGRDQVNAVYKLLTEGLGIKHLFAVTGISMGGMQSLQMAVSYPRFVDGIVPIVGGALWGTHGYFRGPWMLSILRSCAGWNDGNYVENPKECATNSISAMVPYFYSRDWWQQYVDTPEAYTRWRIAWGDYYLDIQDARDLYYLILSFGRSAIGDTPGFGGDWQAALRSIKAKTLFIASSYEQFFLPEQIEMQAKLIPNARVVSIDSIAGHLICCSGDPQATRAMGEALRGFLTELSEKRRGTK